MPSSSIEWIKHKFLIWSISLFFFVFFFYWSDTANHTPFTVYHFSFIDINIDIVVSPFQCNIVAWKSDELFYELFFMYTVYINHRQGVINCGIANTFSTQAGSRQAAGRQEFSSIHLLSLFTLIFHCHHGSLLPHLKVLIFFFFISFAVVRYKRKTIDSRCAH